MSGGQMIGLVAVMIPIVAIIMSHLTKMREASARGLSEEAATALLDRADRLNERVATLERILDTDSPGWRSRS
jgi:phage shock protein B